MTDMTVKMFYFKFKVSFRCRGVFRNLSRGGFKKFCLGGGSTPVGTQNPLWKIIDFPDERGGGWLLYPPHPEYVSTKYKYCFYVNCKIFINKMTLWTYAVWTWSLKFLAKKINTRHNICTCRVSHETWQLVNSFKCLLP